jgi:LacI family transcriptional regulator
MKHTLPRRPAKAATIRDVAREAGVSAMTVSRVVNNENSVRAVTRERVAAAIGRLNYSPNLAARSLAGAKEIRIALLYSNPSANYLSELLVGSLDCASRANVQLIVQKCEVGDREVDVAQKLVDAGIDGFVLSSPLCDSPGLIRAIVAADLPAVAVGSGAPSPAFLAVSIDEFAAARAMTRHILALGHRRIGFIMGDPAQSESWRRLEGYRAALSEAGLAAGDHLVARGQFTYKSGLAATEALLEGDEPPTAIFASNDDMAAAAVSVAHRQALEVPADLTVCGFDDTSLATAIWPELTTIRQPVAAMAGAGIELLIDEIRSRRDGGPACAPHVELEYRLVRRESDGAPGARSPNTPSGIASVIP